MRRNGLRNALQLAAVIALASCFDRTDTSGNETAATRASDTSTCSSGFPQQQAEQAAAVSWAKSDSRLLAYGENGEGYHAVIPGMEKYDLKGGEDQKYLKLFEISVQAPTPAEDCVADCALPLSACGLQQEDWAARYNRAICEHFDRRGNRRCGIRYTL